MRKSRRLANFLHFPTLHLEVHRTLYNLVLVLSILPEGECTVQYCSNSQLQIIYILISRIVGVSCIFYCQRAKVYLNLAGLTALYFLFIQIN